MDARNEHLLKFVQNAPQFVIPIYQRKYSWQRKHCAQLWDDILMAGRDNQPGGHFVGSIVYVADEDAFDSPLLVIDGQQRLTTLTLLIVALSHAIGEQEIVESFDREKLVNYYLIRPHETGGKSRRLVLSETDRDTLFAIIDGRDLPDPHSIQIVENFQFFEGRVAAEKDRLDVVCRGLSKLLVVQIALSRESDNPQLVFESMNSKGLDLSQADLIRNYILMGLEPHVQERLYSQYWRPMEQAFGQEAYDHHFDRFMRDYLTVKTREIPKLKNVYVAFKNFARRQDESMEVLVSDIRRFSRYYCAMVLEQESNHALGLAFRDLRELGVNVAYPMLLEIYADYAKNSLGVDDFLEVVRLIESYVFRRAVCEIPTNSLNKTFATFCGALDKTRYLESVTAHLLSLQSYRRFPDDDEFKQRIQGRDLYNSQRVNYWLGRLENFDHREPVSVGDYTIEHIMPQSLTDQWKVDLGDDWERIHAQYLHTLGNLTLTGYNSQYSNRPFKEKRDMEGGFKESRLRLNDGLRELDEWSKQAIDGRARRLAEKASRVWAYPKAT